VDAEGARGVHGLPFSPQGEHWESHLTKSVGAATISRNCRGAARRSGYLLGAVTWAPK